MQLRKLGATLGTVCFLAGAGLTQAATPVMAAPAGSTVSTEAASFKDFKKGYRDGFRDGWRMAREECEEMQQMMFKLNDKENDYMRGYNKGFDKGFDKGFREYCD